MFSEDDDELQNLNGSTGQFFKNVRENNDFERVLQWICKFQSST